MLSEVIYIYSARFKDVYLRFGKAHRRIVQKMPQKDTIEFLFPQGLEVYGRMGAFPPKKTDCTFTAYYTFPTALCRDLCLKIILTASANISGR